MAGDFTFAWLSKGNPSIDLLFNCKGMGIQKKGNHFNIQDYQEIDILRRSYYVEFMKISYSDVRSL